MLQTLLNGLFLGSLFTLIAVGLTLIYGVMEIPNFAHAGIVVAGGYAAWVTQQLGAPFVIVVIVAIAVASGVSVLTEVVAYRWIRSKPEAAPAVALGLLLILQNLALWIWGAEGKALNTPYDDWSVVLWGTTVPGIRVVVVLTALVAVGALAIFLNRTSVGRAIRAVAQDREAATIVGIPVGRQYALAFLLSGLLGGVAAVTYAPTYQVSPFMADSLLLSGFVVIVLGGLGSVSGAIVGGLALGMVQTFGATYISAPYQSAFGFLLLVLLLVVKPTGIRTTTVKRVA